jgi:thiamine biosynthesis protein ThiS
MTDGAIRVTVNGEQRELSAGLSVEEFLRSLELHPKLIVVERNGEILARDAYATTRVESGDTLELVHFVGGG